MIVIMAALFACDDIVVDDPGYSLASLTAPTGLSASQGDYTDRITITWNAAAGADYYRVYRCATADGDFGTAPAGNDWTHITNTTYTDHLVTRDRTFSTGSGPLRTCGKPAP
jgi:hypothetical protein